MFSSCSFIKSNRPRNSPRPALLLIVFVASVWARGPALAADGDKLLVATTFTVIADLAKNVAGDAADVVSITRPGSEIHNYQPTPRDLIRVRDADVVLWNGLGLERWFEKFISRVKNATDVVVSAGVEPLPIRDGPYSDQPNPHAWMSPDDVSIYIRNIEQALSTADPDNAALYKANAEAYLEEIASVALSITERLNTCLLYTSPSPRDRTRSRMPSSA